MKKTLCTILIISMFIIAISSCAPTANNAKKVTPGMTYLEVCEIMGGEGVDVGSGYIIYEWELLNGKVFSVAFAKNSNDELIVEDCGIIEDK